MRKPRRALATPLAASLVALAACSTSPPAAGRELTVWIMGDGSARFQQLVSTFTARTRVRVDAVAVPWNSIDQKFTTAVASGKGPDVLQIGLSKLRAFAASGALLRLDRRTLDGHPNLAAARFLDGLAGDGTAAGVPWVSDTRVLFYRRDILAAQGITRPPATWEELRATARTLAARGGGAFGYHIPQWDNTLPVIMTWTRGGEIVDGNGKIDFDTPEFHRAVDTYLGLYADGSVPTDADFDQVQGFVTGATPMLVSGPYLADAIESAAPQLKGRWWAAPVPGGHAHTSLLAGSALGVWRAGGRKEDALRLLDYLSEPSTQVAWYRLSGQLPAVKAALDDAALAADPLVAVYSRQLRDARPLPPVPDWDGDTGKALLDALNSIVLTGADREGALRALYAATGGTAARP
ncbi:extracellular solute-binding protein [Nonomuraea sp. NPDC050783]|uniref:extracellular solute-binding protein n=1 Tax=Nonomuraea sp. NPDC050783 TaxID=3154634 RepID=UPI0034664CBA